MSRQPIYTVAIVMQCPARDIHQEFTFQPQLRNKMRLVFSDLEPFAQDSEIFSYRR